MMMTFIFIFIALVLVGITLLFLGWLPVKVVSNPDQVVQWLKSLPQAIGTNLYFIYLRIGLAFTTMIRRKTTTALQFRTWLDQELTSNPDLRSWIMDLPTPALEALTDGAERFCANFNIQLSWLFGPDLDVAPAVSETVKVILSDYLTGCFKAVNNKEAISLFSVYHQLTAPDQLSRLIDLRRSVFKKVTALGLTEPIPAYDLIMSSEHERQELAASALRDAATKDWQSFSQALSNVLAENEHPAT
jgi:hypothetical protein